MQENFIQLLRKKAKYALITNEFHIENFLDFEDLIDLSEFKEFASEKTSFYDNLFWNEISFKNKVDVEDAINKELFN